MDPFDDAKMGGIAKNKHIYWYESYANQYGLSSRIQKMRINMDHPVGYTKFIITCPRCTVQ